MESLFVIHKSIRERDYDMVGTTFHGICETLEETFLMDLEHISEVALHASICSDLTEA